MPDYQEMYCKMARAAEKAIRILIEAQQQCEELAVSEDAPCAVLPINTVLDSDAANHE